MLTLPATIASRRAIARRVQPSFQLPLLRAAFVLVALLPAGASAQSLPNDAPAKIRDNLFLLEEAYNQEPGVIQHIQGMVWSPRTTSWNYSVTDEWPAPTDRHQLSVTVPVSGTGRSSSALADVLVNYRLQVVGAGGAGRLAVAPRVSLVLPTQSGRAARGALGLQFNVPVSIELGDRFVAHLNGGCTVTPGVDASSSHVTALDTNVGAALVWLATPRANAVLELLHTSTADVLERGGVHRTGTFTVNPGMRFALNFPSGLQVVPGISVPIQFPRVNGGYGVLAYLSLEHPLWQPARRK